MPPAPSIVAAIQADAEARKPREQREREAMLAAFLTQPRGSRRMNEFAKPTVEDVDTAMRAFEALLADLTTRRDGLLARPRLTSRFEHGQLADCQLAITQLQKGVQPEDGVLPEVDALVHSEQVRRLTLKAPGLASLQRLRDSLSAVPETAPAAGPYRLREGARHSLQDRDLRPGEVIELTAQHAASDPSRA